MELDFTEEDILKLEYITFKLGFKNVYETLEYLIKRGIEADLYYF